MRPTCAAAWPDPPGLRFDKSAPEPRYGTRRGRVAVAVMRDALGSPDASVINREERPPGAGCASHDRTPAGGSGPARRSHERRRAFSSGDYATRWAQVAVAVMWHAQGSPEASVMNREERPPGAGSTSHDRRRAAERTGKDRCRALLDGPVPARTRVLLHVRSEAARRTVRVPHPGGRRRCCMARGRGSPAGGRGFGRGSAAHHGALVLLEVWGRVVPGRARSASRRAHPVGRAPFFAGEEGAAWLVVDLAIRGPRVAAGPALG
jgi:hypothetical protein